MLAVVKINNSGTLEAFKAEAKQIIVKKTVRKSN